MFVSVWRSSHVTPVIRYRILQQVVGSDVHFLRNALVWEMMVGRTFSPISPLHLHASTSYFIFLTLHFDTDCGGQYRHMDERYRFSKT
jgi:hypothetical protein